MKSVQRNCHAAFTLVELLVVIAIIGLLAGLSVPVVSTVVRKADTTKCASNMRQVGIYISLYEADTQLFPKLGGSGEVIPWAFRLVDEDILKSYANAPELYEQEEVFRCPSDKLTSGGTARPSYAINHELAKGPNGVLPSNRPLNVTKPGKVIMLGETHANRDQRSYLTISDTEVGSGSAKLAFDRHQGKSNFLFADGHVELLSSEETLDPVQGLNLWDPSSE